MDLDHMEVCPLVCEEYDIFESSSSRCFHFNIMLVLQSVAGQLFYNNNNNNDRLTAFDPGQPG